MSLTDYGIQIDGRTQATLKYIPSEWIEQITMNNPNFGNYVNPERALVEVLFNNLKDMRMYENVDEFERDLNLYMRFPGYQEFFNCNLGDPIELVPWDLYKSLKGKTYICTKCLFPQIQGLFGKYKGTHYNCLNSKFLSTTMLLALRNMEKRIGSDLELIKCTPEQIQSFLTAEVFEKETFVPWKLPESPFDILFCQFPLVYDFTKAEVDILLDLYKEECDEVKNDEHKEYYAMELFQTCDRWLKNFYAAVKEKPEWFQPGNGPNVVPIVRLFVDNGRRYVMIPELVKQMERAGISFDFMQLPKNVFLSDEIATIDFKEIFELVGTENMSKIEFVITPICRAKHAAVPIPTRDGRFCIPAADALIELLKKLILGKKVFQRTDKKSWPLVKIYLNRITAYFNGENVSYFFIDLSAFEQIRDECDDEFKKLGLSNVITIINDVENNEMDADKIKEQLQHLKLNRVFPNIMEHAELALEQILSSRYDDSLKTSDMYDAVEYCQMACIFEHFPKLKEFLHSQKSCHRIINSNCSTCVLPCSMKTSKWEHYDSILGIQHIPSGRSDGMNFSVYPLCTIGNNYNIYPFSSFLRDTYHLEEVFGQEKLVKHEEVISLVETNEILPFALIDISDRYWYYQVLLTELISKNETIRFSACIERIMRRKRDKVFLRTMWKREEHTKTCVGVLKEELLYILPFLLKQQNLYTKKNAEKLRKLNIETEKGTVDKREILQVFSLRELREVFEMFNINKELIVLAPDYHFFKNTPDSIGPFFRFPHEYESSYGSAYVMHEALLFIVEQFGTICDWSEVLESNSSDQNLKDLHALVFECMIKLLSAKNTYIVLKPIISLLEKIESACHDRNINTFDFRKIKDGNPGEAIKFRTFIDHPLVKLGNVFSDRGKQKLRNTKVARWRILVAVLLLAIENLLKNDHPELKAYLISNLQLCAPSNAPLDLQNVVDLVVYGDTRFPHDVTKSMKEFFRKRKINQVEPTVDNVFRLVLYRSESDKTTFRTVGKTIEAPEKSNTASFQSLTESEKLPNMNSIGQHDPVQKPPENLKETYMDGIPKEEAHQSHKLVLNSLDNNKKKSKKHDLKEQKLINETKQDEVLKNADNIKKCGKCYQARLECNEAKKECFEGRKKVSTMEKKLKAKDEELDAYKKRESEIKEMMTKKYKDQLSEANRKLEELMKQYMGERNTSATKINELEQRLEWRTVEVNRKVDEVTRNKQRELDEKDEIAKRLQDTILQLTQQSKSKDILTRALQENVRELTQQLQSQDLILQTVPHQIPSPSSSNQHQEQPLTSTSCPSNEMNTTSSQGREPEDDIKAILNRLKSDRERIIKENSIKQGLANKLFLHRMDRETSGWVNYEMRKFNVEYQPYLEALNDRISTVEKIDQLSPLPPAPGFSEKFMKMYDEIVKKDKVLTAKNYTRNKAPVLARPPQELEDQECLICLTDMVDKSKTLKCEMCSRRYHTNCLGSWLLKKRLCPTCEEGMLLADEFPAP